MTLGTSTRNLPGEHKEVISELALNPALSPSDIHKLLDRYDFQEPYSRDLRMTQRYVKQIRGNLDPVLEELFDYELFPQAGIPWEAGEFLLDMWAYDEEMAAFRERSAPDGFFSGGRAAITRRATMRKAKLWWKVHQAVPNEFPPDSAETGRPMKRRDFIFFECEILWIAEFSTHVLGNPIDVSGHWAYLGYRPWEEANLMNYRRAVSEGRVKEKISGIGTFWDVHGDLESISLTPLWSHGVSLKFADV